MLYLQEAGTATAISVSDVNQDGIGDCFLLAAIGELALNHPDAVTNMISPDADGSETVRLYADQNGDAPGQGGTALAAVSVTVNDVFPDDAVNSGPNQDVFDGQKEIWVQVLEKAVASLNGGYDVLNQGGWAGNAMEELTGKAAVVVAPAAVTAQQLTGDAAAGDLVVFDTPASADLPFDLVDDHSYMFEGVVSVGGTAMVQLGNPWGDDEPPLVPVSQLASAFDQIDVQPWTVAPPPAPTGITLAAASDSGVQGDGITNQPSPTFTGSAEAGTTVTLLDSDDSLGAIGSGAVDQAGHWSITTVALPDGAHGIEAVASDAAGNLSAASEPLYVVVDTKPPAAPASLALGASGGADSTDDDTPTISGTGEANATVTLFDGASPVGSAVVGADSRWSVTTSVLALGDHSLAATETDVAGNASGMSAALTIDIVPPSPTSRVTLGGGEQSYDAAAGQIVQAGNGSDTIAASAGQVTVTGGSGRLTFLGGAVASSVGGGSGSAVLFGGAGGGNYAGGAAGHNILVSQGEVGILTMLTGIGTANQIFGSASGDDILTGGSGEDSILGGGGDTTINGGTGSVIFTGGGSTTVNGGSGGRDTVVGGSGALAVTAQDGDAVFGNAGALTITASLDGADSIVGGSGALNLAGRGANMLVVAGSSSSVISTGNGASLVFAGSGNLSLTGGTGSMQVIAGSGRATITEGSGPTVVQVVDGAAGGADVLSGFRAATDRIELFGYTAAQQSITTAGGSTTIALADGTRLTLLGVSDLGGSVLAA